MVTQKPPDELIEVFLDYLQSQFDWTVSHEDLVFIPEWYRV